MSNDKKFVVRVPANNLGHVASNIHSMLQTWEWKYRIPRDSTAIKLDFSAVKFIEPWALTMFTAYARHVAQQCGQPLQVKIDYSNPTNQYLLQMGLFNVLEKGQSTPDWDESTQNTGLHIIKSHADVSRFAESATNLTSHVSSDALDALRYGIHELGRNVVQHAASKVGGIAMAQYFPDRKSIQIAVSDCGRGILDSLCRTYPEVKNDLESLKLAVLPHVSGAFQQGAYSGSDNAGLGLFFVKEICWRSGGSFWIASKRAIMGVVNDEERSHDRKYRNINQWDGTCVVMDFPASRPAEFAELLSLCRELANRARSNSGKAGLDFLERL